MNFLDWKGGRVKEEAAICGDEDANVVAIAAILITASASKHFSFSDVAPWIGGRTSPTGFWMQL